jgi:maltose alpha-D-glucosyltransferase/alpha-amylase
MIAMDKMGGALSEDSRAALETHVLPAYLPHRRWFSAKGEPVQATRLLYCVRLPGAEDVWLGEVAVHFLGHSETYTLPLAARWDDDASPLARQLALSPLRDGDRAGLLTDAFAVDGLAYATLALLRAGATLDLPDGQQLHFLPTSALLELSLSETPSIRRLSAEQSNSSLILGDAVVLKLVRHVAAGINPETEVTRVLTERGYANCAPLFGEVVRVTADGTPHTVMLAQGFLRNQGDGWEWTLRALADGGEALDRLNGFSAQLGQRLAELHAILAQPSDDPGFAPEPADEATRLAWAGGATAQLELALDLLRMPRDLPDRDAACAGWLLDNTETLRAAIRRLAALGEGAMNHRVHGDFHLGQVLVADGDAYIVDFEGEPARTLAQRREKSCAMRDVAGLLRSFDYAAATATMRHGGSAHIRPACAQAERAFMTAYQATLARAADTAVPPAAQTPLLDLFLIEKAAYEIRYEAANRPTWLGIPLRGLHEIATRILAHEDTP